MKLIHSPQLEIAMKSLSAGLGHGERPHGAAIDRFEGQYQKQFEEKVHLNLRGFRFFIFVKSPSRKNTILQSLIHATSALERPTGNALVTNGKQLVLSPQEMALFWHLPTKEMTVAGIQWATSAGSPSPAELITTSVTPKPFMLAPFEFMKERIRISDQVVKTIILGHNTYQGVTRPAYQYYSDRVTHMNIIGKTRVGKTTFMQNMIFQDLHYDRGVGVIDPHGDLIKSILQTCIPQERLNDVVLFDLADPQNLIPLNLLYVPPDVPRHAAVGSTLSVMKRMFADQWSATRMEDALYAALMVLSDVPSSTIRDIPRLFLEPDYRQDALTLSQDQVAHEYWDDEFSRMSEGHQLEVARPILNRVRTFYRNPVIREVIDQPISIDFTQLLNEGKIFLASLAAEGIQGESDTLGALLISKIQLAAMSRSSLPVEKRRTFYLYIDEVQNFITTSLSTMFSEAAKYGLSLTVANQYLSQLEGKTLDAIMGNTGTTVVFACGNKDAEDLAPYVGPYFNKEKLMNLNRFQAVLKMQHDGKSLHTFDIETLPPPVQPSDGQLRASTIRMFAPQQVQKLIAVSPSHQVETTPLDRADPENAEYFKMYDLYKDFGLSQEFYENLVIHKDEPGTAVVKWIASHPEDEKTLRRKSAELRSKFADSTPPNSSKHQTQPLSEKKDSVPDLDLDRKEQSMNQSAASEPEADLSPLPQECVDYIELILPKVKQAYPDYDENSIYNILMTGWFSTHPDELKTFLNKLSPDNRENLLSNIRAYEASMQQQGKT